MVVQCLLRRIWIPKDLEFDPCLAGAPTLCSSKTPPLLGFITVPGCQSTMVLTIFFSVESFGIAANELLRMHPLVSRDSRVPRQHQ